MSSWNGQTTCSCVHDYSQENSIRVVLLCQRWRRHSQRQQWWSSSTNRLIVRREWWVMDSYAVHMRLYSLLSIDSSLAFLVVTWTVAPYRSFSSADSCASCSNTRQRLGLGYTWQRLGLGRFFSPWCIFCIFYKSLSPLEWNGAISPQVFMCSPEYRRLLWQQQRQHCCYPSRVDNASSYYPFMHDSTKQGPRLVCLFSRVLMMLFMPFPCLMLASTT